ncbi:hypothetical protein [Sphingomonas sp.]|uniref:hypothetical protein n=1 Tax=Sphingomonas sp. TaxID=28214 RepID=UPI002E36F3BA|nr:hypothetical protein [Sphingomonas sp.]HEX4694380.1 hypothetical protein [Sphingomonas sp.]
MLTALVLFAAAKAVQPRAPEHPPARRYASENYELAFPTPANIWTCPFRADWSGTDHGTVLFLTPPKSCAGVGYLSSDRAFGPPTTPRIELYYDRTFIPDGVKPFTDDPCRKIGAIRLFGQLRPLCVERSKWGITIVSVASLYKAKRYETRIALITTGARYQQDLRALKRFATTIGTCDQNRQKGPRVCTGTY